MTALLDIYFYTSFWISSSVSIAFIFFSSYTFFSTIFEVWEDWYYNSWINWWFWSRVNLVLLLSCSFFISKRLFLISLNLSIISLLYVMYLSLMSRELVFSIDPYQLDLSYDYLSTPWWDPGDEFSSDWALVSNWWR